MGGGAESDESKFIWYWYQLVWALEGCEKPEATKYYINPHEARSLFKNALIQLERAMEKTLLAELRQKHRRKVAGGQWLALHRRLESFERSTNTFAPREKALPADAINDTEAEKIVIQKELTVLGEELGQEEVSRIRNARPLPLCGTAMLRASQWTAEKQHEDDTRLLREVEEFLADRDRID